MLLSFRFANHRSFRDEQQLNLTPVYADGAPSEQAPEAVTVAGIFGANASGKSNTLDALSYMRRLTLRSDREVEPGEGIRRTPFRLQSQIAAEPSRYVVDVLLDDVRFTYGFSIDDDQVLEEWLYNYPHNRQRKVFEREYQDFTWGDESGKLRELARIAEITAPTALFLSTLARFDLRAAEPSDTPTRAVYRWFRRIAVEPAGHGRNGEFDWAAVPERRDLVVSLLQAADVGISGVVVRSPKGDSHIQAQLAAVMESIEQDHHELSQQSVAPERLDLLRTRLDRHQQDLIMIERQYAQHAAVSSSAQLQFIHRGSDGHGLLDLADESAGTRQILMLATQCIDTLSIGGLMTVDEIDASLHPMLTAKMIGLFQSERTNPLRSQLLFTSHDATLLGTFDAEEVLRRDQVWFTEKGRDGASTLFPLAEFKPRKQGENRQRRYLNGSYGAVPDLSKDLFEQVLTARGDFGGSETE